MLTAVTRTQAEFYREFLMGRGSIDPREFGVDVDREEFMDQMNEEFAHAYQGSLSLDELLLRPRLAAGFCDSVRNRRRYYDVPDDIILRAIMTRRKNPAG